MKKAFRAQTEKLRGKRRNNQSRKSKVVSWVLDILAILIASALYSIGIHCFTEPNEIAPGGITGIATIISDLYGFSIGTVYALLNIPLIIIGFIFLGKRLMIKTLTAVAAISFFTDNVMSGFPVYTGDTLLAAVMGGALLGGALGIIYLREGTTGGMDIINKLIYRRAPHISLGTITLLTDAVIVLLAMAYYRRIDTGLYAIIAIFVASRVLDLLLYGSMEGKLLLIFSDSFREIADRIMLDHDRGVTFLNGRGAYSGKEKNVICCAVQKNEYVKIKRLVREIDPRAFIITSKAGEVIGEGFSEE